MVLDSTTNETLNQDGIDNTILTLDNIIDNLVADLNQIDMIIYNLDDYFKGNVADELKNKFATYRNKYDVLKANLSTYPSDLVKVKNGISDLMLSQIGTLENATDDIKSQIKDV